VHVTYVIDVKKVQIKIKKNVKNIKNVTNIKNVCKRNKNVTSSARNGLQGNSEYAIQFSLAETRFRLAVLLCCFFLLHLITGYSIMLNFVAVILKVLLVNLLAALNFANVY